MATEKGKEKQHLLAVLLEDYFQVGAFDGLIQPRQWYRFEARYERNTLAALDLLDRHRAGATFFVLDWIAERCPELIREVARRGHEIACYSYLDFDRLLPSDLREELTRSREKLERVSGTRVFGFRSAHRWAWPRMERAQHVLAGSGFAYDASVVPDRRSLRGRPERRFAVELDCGGRSLWEFPVPTWRAAGLLVPIAGGNYFRQLPHTLLRRAVAGWTRAYDAPFVMYFHVWELDPTQPRISSASPLARIRHYRNLDKMARLIEDYLGSYRFTGFARYLGAEVAQASGWWPPPLQSGHKPEACATSPRRDAAPESKADRTPVTIVIPCHNEEQSLPYLKNTLHSVGQALGQAYEVNFLFVDDASTDGTWRLLRKLFGREGNCTLLRHARNGGVAAAIMTGVRGAETEVVCSIDCDCTYDPHELQNMIPLLGAGVSLVTASPYHAEGRVLNVPAWRLFLSKVSSLLYRRVLRQKLATYTSCFRVYRKSDVADLQLEEGGFLGVAELLGRLDLGGRKVVEHPATLEVRLFGRSKMKLARTVVGHLRLLSKLLAARVVSRGQDCAASQFVTAPAPEPQPQSVETSR
jgi:polysaccharide deacetylase family protein (PEP-CTERM system associated)